MKCYHLKMKKFFKFFNPSFPSIFIYFDSWEFYHFFCLTLSLGLTRLWLRDERIIDVHWSALSVQPQRGFRCLHYSDFLSDQRNWVYGSYQGPLWMIYLTGEGCWTSGGGWNSRWLQWPEGPLTWSLMWCTELIIFLVNHADDKIQ